MTGIDKNLTKHRRKTLSVRPDSPGKDYPVGYGKPPTDTRFRKGRSGNPKGRPKGSKNRIPVLHETRLQDIILEEAYRTIKVNDGARQVTVPMAQAVVRSMAVAAAKGNTRAQRLFSEMLHATESSRYAKHEEYLKAMIDYKAEWDDELARRKRFGIDHLPDPIPHPDHIVVDMRTGTASLKGPWTKEEKIEFDKWHERKIEWLNERAQIKADFDDPDYRNHRVQLLEELDHIDRLLDLVSQVIPD